MTSREYEGSELELFAKAHNWKRYYRTRIQPYIRGDVLEVGAGIGGTTRDLCSGRERSWICIEPDPQLARELAANVARMAGPTVPKVLPGMVDDLPATATFDCILYIDVLEHIADDHAELASAAARLRPSGHLVALSPAHQFLFSEFDRHVGHLRRYDEASLRAMGAPLLELRDAFYLDSLGIALSLANRILLRRSCPAPSQLQFWDRFVVPGSRILDPLLRYRVGKTVVAAWQRASG